MGTKSKTKQTATEKVDALLVDLTERVIQSIEDNPGDWTRPWRATLASGLPINALTTRRYSGGNLFWLSLVAQSEGWTDNVWATYKQWAQLDCQVRKGEGGTLALFYKQVKITEENDDGEKVTKTIPLLRSFYLFNAAQVEGADVVVAERFKQTDAKGADHLDRPENFFHTIGADLRFGGDRAFYRRTNDLDGGDFIQVPDPATFVSTEAYYATLSHEHVHWTGAEHRLDRSKGKHFGDEVYAREELVAELGATFVMSYLGIDTEAAEGCDNTAYLASWIKTLKEQPRALWSVLGDSSKALDYLVHEAGENGDTIEHEEAA